MLEPASAPRRDIVLLGSTGSIGTQAADIIRRNPGRFRVAGLAAGGEPEPENAGVNQQQQRSTDRDPRGAGCDQLPSYFVANGLTQDRDRK